MTGQLRADDALSWQRDSRDALALVDLRLSRLYEAHLKRSGAPPSATGPDLQALWQKSPWYAALAREHRPSMAGSALPSLVPPGLTPRQHMRAAAELEHPFARSPPLEADLQYVVGAYAARGPDVQELRAAAWRSLSSLAEAVSPMDDYLRDLRHVQIRDAPGLAPAFAFALGLGERAPLAFGSAAASEPPAGAGDEALR